MGIANLNKFLRGKCPQVFKTINLSELSYMKGSVDISLFVFKYKTIFGDKWLTALLNLVTCLRQNNIHACFIYDTSAPVEKDEERHRRKEQRDKLDTKLMELTISLEKAKLTGELDPILYEFNKSIKTPAVKSLLRPGADRPLDLEFLENELLKKQKQCVTIGKDDFDESKRLLEVCGIPWFNAPCEAETTCADMCKRGLVDVVFSEDTDVLCYGAPFVVTKVNTAENTAVIVKYADILEGLELTSEQFTDFCIMCGTDYNKNIFKVGPEKSFKLIKEFGSIDNISGLDTAILNHVRVRQLFKDYERCNVEVNYCNQPDLQKLYEFISRKNIRINLQKIKDVFSTIEFEILDD
jgi:5'-3' exonuclease